MNHTVDSRTSTEFEGSLQSLHKQEDISALYYQVETTKQTTKK